MSAPLLTLEELLELPLGSTIADWEGDVLEKEAPDKWCYKYQPMRGDKPRAFSSEVMQRAYSATLMRRAPEPVAEPVQHVSRDSLRERARRAAWGEWNRRWTLGEYPSVHRYADAIADAVVDVLFPKTAPQPRANQVYPAPVPAVHHASVQVDQ